jgi:hypothetical protein
LRRPASPAPATTALTATRVRLLVTHLSHTLTLTKVKRETCVTCRDVAIHDTKYSALPNVKIFIFSGLLCLWLPCQLCVYGDYACFAPRLFFFAESTRAFVLRSGDGVERLVRCAPFSICCLSLPNSHTLFPVVVSGVGQSRLSATFHHFSVFVTPPLWLWCVRAHADVPVREMQWSAGSCDLVLWFV